MTSSNKKARLARVGKKDLDFSVTREALPPLGSEAGAAQHAEWVTVVDARNITTGSISKGQESSMLRFLLLGGMVLIGSILLFWRHLPPGFGCCVCRLALAIRV